MRRLDEAKSTDVIPAHSYDRVEKLKPGEIVPVEIDMFPIGLAFIQASSCGSSSAATTS